MNFFYFKNGELYCEDVSVRKIVEKTGTPVYIYSASSIRNSIKNLRTHLPENSLICYSLKANSNASVLKIVREENCGADVVSGGELFRALRAQIPPQKIVFSGIGKTEEEIEFALRSGILFINVESEEELEVVNEVGRKCSMRAPISVRVNPDVSSDTHHYIKTGMKENKFGLLEEEALVLYRKAREMENVKILGIQCHIGSQILSVEPFKIAFNKLKNFIMKLKEYGIEIKFIDFGGGIGIRYKDEDSQFDLHSYGKIIKDITFSFNLSGIVEPGRYIVGEAGILVGRVLYFKKTPFKNFIITDIGMNDLIRPSLYGAYHRIVPLKEMEGNYLRVDVVGPVCESGDFIARDITLPSLKRNDYLAVLCAGAYGFTMSSNYNSRPRPPEVMVEEGNFTIARVRECYEDLIFHERKNEKNPL